MPPPQLMGQVQASSMWDSWSFIKRDQTAGVTARYAPGNRLKLYCVTIYVYGMLVRVVLVLSHQRAGIMRP